MAERIRSNRKRIMETFTISEISAVDVPAQAGAKMALMKRAPEDIEKASKTEDGKQFPASDYAYVPDPESPSTWKLRLTSTPGGTPDPTIVGAAAAALGPGYRGQKVQLPAADRAKVVTRVRAAWVKANPDKDKDAMPKTLQKDYYGGDAPSQLVTAASQEVKALDFEEVMAAEEAREASMRVKDCVWASWNALQRSFDTIAADASLDPAAKVSAMQASLQQFLDALSSEAADIAEEITKSLTAAVPALAELLGHTGTEGEAPMTDVEKKQFTELQKQVEALTKQLEAATGEESARKAAELQGQLDELTKKLETAQAERDDAVAKAAMSDGEKAYCATLDKEGRGAFMAMTPEERKKAMQKQADSDPVVYKSESSGEEFRKSDDPRLVTMAKQADEDRKIAKRERELRETAELTKRADDVLKSFSGKTEDKVEVLRAISKMDEGPRAELEKMLAAGGKAIAAAFETIGHQQGDISKSGADFEKRVSEIVARDKCTKTEALRKARVEDPAAFEAYQSAGAVRVQN